MAHPVYLDHAATTPVDPRVRDAMLPYLGERFGNPSSPHGLGRVPKMALEEARERVAAALGADSPLEIIFTSGGTEADNLAVLGFARANRSKGKHIITSAIEHHAVLHACEQAEREGFEVTYLPVDSTGRVSVQAVEQAIRPDTILISVMWANNEVGTLQPVAEIAALAKSRGIAFHTDAVQAFGALHVSARDVVCDLLSISSHKIYGPKGAGALYIRKGTALEPLMIGGPHEFNLRAGTENVPGIVGFGEAARLAALEYRDRAAKAQALRDAFIAGIQKIAPDAILTGHPADRLPGNAHFLFPGIESGTLIAALDLAGVCISAGSACTAGAIEPSHVLKAMGYAPALARCAARFTFGCENTESDVRLALPTLEKVLRRV